MSANSDIEWTDATVIIDRGGARVRLYRRQDPDRPGQQERRRKAAEGFKWCRGCREWLASDQVTKQGVCRTHANEEYRLNYAGSGGAEIREQKYARKRGVARVPAWWRAERMEEFGGMCAYGCGRPATSLDHVWPIARGGESRPANLVPACSSCNPAKKHHDPEQWIARGLIAFPEQWEDIVALAEEHGEPWTVAA